MKEIMTGPEVLVAFMEQFSEHFGLANHAEMPKLLNGDPPELVNYILLTRVAVLEMMRHASTRSYNVNPEHVFAGLAVEFDRLSRLFMDYAMQLATSRMEDQAN